jgi:hypothetical protein
VRGRAAVAILALAGLTAAGASNGSEAGSARRIAGFGLSLRIPDGWDGRVWKPKVDYPIDPMVFAASFPLPEHEDPLGSKALAEVTPTRVLVRVFEVGNAPGSNGFRVLRKPVSVSSADLRPYRETSRGRSVMRRRFALHGRSFVLFVDFGTRPPRRRLVRQVNGLLGTLRVRPPVPPGTWKALRRPLALPQLAPGRACPGTRSGRETPETAFGVGSGPAYAVIGGTAAVLAGDLRRNGWVAHKTLWAFGPRYRGAVLIRGRRIDEPQAVRFGLPRHPLGELHVLPGVGWRYAPTATLLRGPGCYAFRIDGRGFRRKIVFPAR